MTRNLNTSNPTTQKPEVISSVTESISNSSDSSPTHAAPKLGFLKTLIKTFDPASKKIPRCQSGIDQIDETNATNCDSKIAPKTLDMWAFYYS